MHCGSDGHKTRVDVDGGCLASALSVMSVQASTMWGLRGVRSLGLHSGSVIADGGGGTGKGRHEMEREIQGRKQEDREEVLSVLIISILVCLTQEGWLGCPWLGLGGDDSKFQRSFSSVPLKR